MINLDVGKRPTTSLPRVKGEVKELESSGSPRRATLKWGTKSLRREGRSCWAETRETFYSLPWWAEGSSGPKPTLGIEGEGPQLGESPLARRESPVKASSLRRHSLGPNGPSRQSEHRDFWEPEVSNFLYRPLQAGLKRSPLPKERNPDGCTFAEAGSRLPGTGTPGMLDT